MEKLSLTCKTLYDYTILQNNQQLQKYKKIYDYPTIKITHLTLKVILNQIDTFMKTNPTYNNDYNIYAIPIMIQVTTICQAIDKMFKIIYKTQYINHDLFFKNQIQKLKEVLTNLQSLDSNDVSLLYLYTEKFLLELFENITIINCSKCKNMVKINYSSWYNRIIPGKEYICRDCDIHCDYQDELADYIDA
jgi:hypothetical protein